MKPPQTKRPPPLQPRLRRWARIVVKTALWAGAAAATLLLAVALLLALPAGRHAALRAGLQIADRELPGALSVRHVAWPRIGELSLDGLLWTDGPDTLARIETLRLSLAPVDLLRRDLRVDLARVAGAHIDLPAIAERRPDAPSAAATAALHSTTDAQASGPGQAATVVALPWLRTGALPLLPSVAIDKLQLARIAIRTRDAHTAHLDSLDLVLDLRRGHQPQLAASLRATALPTLGVSWRLRGTVDRDTLVLSVAPLHLADPTRLPAERDLPLDGRVRVPLATIAALMAGERPWPCLSVDDLLVEGDPGLWRLSAHLRDTGKGRITLSSEMPDAPVALLAGLSALAEDSPLTSAGLDTLARRWSSHGPPGVALTVDLESPPPSEPLTAARLQARGSLRLPAPAAIAPLLPQQLVVDDLGPLELDLTASYDGSRAPAVIAIDLDLQRTAWLDRARLALAGNLDAIDRAEIDLALPGLAVSATGRADRSTLDLDLTASLPDARLLRRWRDPALEELALQADLAVTISGPWLLPRADLNASLAAATADVILPSAVVSASVAADTLHLAVGLPQGLRNPALDVDNLEFVFSGSPLDSLRSLRGRIELAAQAAPVALALRGHLAAQTLDTSPAITFSGEHLAVSMDRRALASTGPWHATYTTADTSVCVTGLQMAGSLGHLDLSGCLTPDSLSADLDLELRLLLDAVRQVLPQEHLAHLPSGLVTATGQVTARGRPALPWARGRVQLAIAEQPDLAGLGADLEFSLAGAGPAPVDLDPGRPGWREGSARLSARLLDGQVPQAVLTASLPWPPAAARIDSLDLRLDAPSLDLARLAPLLPPDHAAAGNLSVQAHVHGALPTNLDAIRAQGTLHAARELDLTIEGAVHIEDLSARLAGGTNVLVGGSVLLSGSTGNPSARADVALAGDLGRIDLSARLRPDSLVARADVDLRVASGTVRPYLPLEQGALLPQGTLSIAGTLAAAGSPQAPWAAGDLLLRVVDQPDLETLSTGVTVLLGGRGDVPVQEVGDRPGWRAESLRLNLRLIDAGSELLRLGALAPLPHLAAAADSVDMRLDAPNLDLARLAPLLPPGTTATGRIQATTRIAGIMVPGHLDPDLDLSGSMKAENLRVQLAEGSRLALRGRIDLAGTSLAPRIRGGLHVEGGLIRLPDPPPALLPQTGEALLWSAVREGSGVQAAAPDPGAPVDPAASREEPAPSSPQQPPEASTDIPTAAAPAGGALPRILPDLILTVTSPGGLWLRGQGLDIELAGDVSLLLRGDRVAVEGELQAVQGTMRQFGHIFRLERGRVVFDGSETELNPELDLALGVRIGSYRIRILLGGTSLTPSLRFASEPEMPEGDILAILLFGKPLDELDEGQTGLLVSRTAQIAMAYGSARLQESLARQIGVDVVSIAPREGDDETTALTVGKYLSPRVLVRYEQLLREGSAFFVHLDYAFAGALRLHTQVSQGEESGIQIKWQWDR